MKNSLKKIETPVNDKTISNLRLGDKIKLYGTIFTGRDAALPKLVRSICNGENTLNLQGSVIMHTAVSQAGISPTTSNKEEIEENIPFLSESGVKIHLGKGSLGQDTIEALDRYQSVFAVTPPAAALLTSKLVSKKVVAFEEEGIEAVYQLEVRGIPAIVAVARGKSLYKPVGES
jgi:fumarate hydratase subunit beta